MDGKIEEEGAVCSCDTPVAHLHQEVEESHIDTTEETIYLAVSCFIEIAVVP